MDITKDQWQKIAGIVLGALIAVAAVLGWVLPLPAATQQIGSQSLAVQRFNQAVQFLLPATFLGSETHSGTETHSGDTTISKLSATTITATNLISQVVGFVGDTATITEATISKLTATNITSTLATDTKLTSVYITSTGTLYVVGVSTLSGGVVGNVTGDVSGNVTGNVTGNLTGKVTGSYITSTNVISMAGATFTGPVKYGTAATYATSAAIVHGFATTPTVCMLWPAEVTATVTITSTGFSCNTAAHTTPVMWMCGQ